MMATSFAAYASQFLNKQQNASPSSSQPMFFSFTTDDGSRGGHDKDDLDDLDDPHLRVSESIQRNDHGYGDDDDDPYLRLDEDDPGAPSHFDSQSIPLMTSEHSPSIGSDSPKGWLAHQRQSCSPSPSPSSNSSPPPDIFNPAPYRSQPQPPPPPPQTNRAPISLSLTESLLPRDGHARPIDVFSLLDPRHTPRGRRKYNDFIWTAIWCTGCLLCLSSCILILFLTRKPAKRPPATLPYTTFLHTVPILTILTFLSAFVAYGHILLLRVFVRPVMVATTVFVPATLLISAVWAFVGSFMWDGDLEPTWGETVGLRLFSLVPLVLSIITARRLVDLPRQIHTASSTLTLTTRLLISNPFLLALSPAILLVSLLFSLPFLTLIFRLLLIGYFSHSGADTSLLEWHVRRWANWAIGGTVVVWLWSWGVARGVLRVTAAGVIGAWYFADPDALSPPPMSTYVIHSALFRATGPSLGSIILSALILTAIRLITFLTLFLRRLPFYIPARVVVAATGMGVRWLEGVGSALSRHALVYVGLTGDPFFIAARRGKALTEQRGRKARGDPPLALLTIAPLTLTFPFALGTYLFVAHTLGAPHEALGASVLAGGITALVGMFCVGLVDDTADTLYICYCIDKDTGERRRQDVFAAFEYEGTRLSATSPQRQQQPNAGLPQRRQYQQQQHQPQQQHPPPPLLRSQHPVTKPKPQPHPQAPPARPEDIDPFEQSYMDDDIRAPAQPRAPAREPLAPAGYPRSPPPAPRGAGAAAQAACASPHLCALSELRGLTSEMGVSSMDSEIVGGRGGRRPTSAELNRKAPAGYSVDVGSDSEDGDGESQIFPGSGLF